MVARLQAAKRVARAPGPSAPPRERVRWRYPPARRWRPEWGDPPLRRLRGDSSAQRAIRSNEPFGLWPLSNIEIQDCRRNDAFDARSGQGLANGWHAQPGEGIKPGDWRTSTQCRVVPRVTRMRSTTWVKRSGHRIPQPARSARCSSSAVC